jgi:hypothetical protein
MPEGFIGFLRNMPHVSQHKRFGKPVTTPA